MANADLHIRPATPDDYPAFVTLFPELRVDDPVPDVEEWTRDIATATWIAQSGEQVVGYCYCQELDGIGYVRNLVTAGAARRQGIGTALMGAVRSRLIARSCKRWCLNVDPKNLPAVALYRRLGFVERYQSVALRFPWDLIDSIRLAPTVATVGLLSPNDDARVEGAMELAPGILGKNRNRGYVNLVAEGAGGTLGVASFEPGFPGAFPFRSRRPDVALQMLRSAKQYALPQFSYMQVVIENDRALADLLIGAGATVRLEFVHYEGSLERAA